MEGLTPEQAATAAQWGPDVGPPGPVSWIMHIIQSQEAQNEESAISGQASESANPATGESPVGIPSPSTPTSDTVSQSTTTPSSFQASVSTPSTAIESSSSAPTTTWSSQDTTTSGPATSTNDWPLISLSIPTSSTTSTSVASSTTGVLSYEPIGGSFSFAPTSTPSSTFISRTSSSSSFITPTNIGSQATETASSDLISMPNSRKQAIVGGLAGAIGAMALIGILLCFCLRRRHRHGDEEEDEEDGLKPVKPMTLATKPSTVRLWNTLGRPEPARSTPEITKPRTPSPVDGSLIRVSTEHWTRPFVRKEGMRESLEPAPLRVVNANSNSSRSSTPQEERPAGFVRKQRSALAAFLQDGSRSESRNAVRRGPISYPKPQPMVSDPIYSSKAEVDSVAETQSFGSLPSDTSGPMVSQHPPEDPFVTSTTMLSTMEEVAPPMDTEPTKTDLTRTVSHFGKNANPFRTQIIPSVALPPRVFSPTTGEFRPSDVGGEPKLPRASFTSNYSRRDTAVTMAAAANRSSDQFDLIVSPDQMPPASGILAKAAEYEQREKEKREKKEREEREREMTPSEASSPNWKVYEGT